MEAKCSKNRIIHKSKNKQIYICLRLNNNSLTRKNTRGLG